MPDFRRNPKKILAPKVMIINFRPAAVPSIWTQADTLANAYKQTMRSLSADTVIYQIVKRKTVSYFPVLEDGRQYTDATWTQARQDDRLAYRDAHGNYVFANYLKIAQDFDLLALVRDKAIDEVWMFGGPYFGFYESRMVGRNALWCNAPPLEQPGRRFVMMGFNYERDVKEMVHNFGHRAESILGAKYGSMAFVNQLYSAQPALTSAPANDFEQFLATYGTTHAPPGGPNYSQDEAAWVKKFKPEWFPPTVDPNKV
ncbi:MAG: hypothetical protein AB1750_13895 [Chloroflexota bacterium]